jgi:periplasmic protein TonB
VPGDVILNGSAKLEAVIGKDGSLISAKILEGHVMLYSAALDAVRRWKYKPFFLEGHRVEVKTEIVVIFKRAGGREGRKSQPN